MKVEIFTILILDILVIGGITLDDVVIEYNSHTSIFFNQSTNLRYL